MKKYDFFKNTKYDAVKKTSVKQVILFIICPIMTIYSLIWDKYFDDILMISPGIVISVIFYFRRNKTYSLIFSFITALLVPIIRIQPMPVCPVLFVILYLLLVFFSIFDMDIILFPSFCIAFQIIALYFFKVEISLMAFIPSILLITFFFLGKFFIYDRNL